MENAIELRHVTKTFGPVIANQDVSLTLRWGEIWENAPGEAVPGAFFCFVFRAERTVFQKFRRNLQKLQEK